MRTVGIHTVVIQMNRMLAAGKEAVGKETSGQHAPWNRAVPEPALQTLGTPQRKQPTTQTAQPAQGPPVIGRAERRQTTLFAGMPSR